MAIDFKRSTCGEFTNELNKHFTYSRVADVPSMQNAWQQKFNLEYVIDVHDSSSPYRYALIKKTVAFIVVDEDQDGFPVFEKWHIKQHRKFLSK